MNGDPIPPRLPVDDAQLEGVWREEHRFLVGLASRILGSTADAEDVVQEAFGRLINVGLDEIRDRRAWLTVAVRRLCLNRLQSAYARLESVAGSAPPESVAAAPVPVDPSDRVTLDDQVQLALAVVLDRLTPAERTAFVLHDVFGLPFGDIAEIVGRTSASCRQLASRARRSIRDGGPSTDRAPGAPGTFGVVAERFIAACDGGSMSDLIAVLDPDVVGEAMLLRGRVLSRVEGREAVATTAMEMFGSGSTMTLVPVLLEGSAGIVGFAHGRVRAVIRLDVADGLVRDIRAFIRLRSADTTPDE